MAEDDQIHDMPEELRLFTASDKSALAESLAREGAAWEWIKDISDLKIRRAAAAAYSILVELPIQEAVKNLSTGLLAANSNSPFIKAGSPEGALVRRCQDEGYQNIAFFVFILITQRRREIAATVPDIHSVLSDPLYEYERLTAVTVINQFYSMDLLALNGGRDSIYDEATGFQKEIKNLKFEAQSQLSDIHKVATEAKRGVKQELSLARKTLLRRRRTWLYIARKTAADARDKVTSAHAHLEAAKEALNSQIDLKASVEYWNERKVSHSKSRTKSLWAVIISMAATLGVMYSYFKFIVLSVPAGVAAASAASQPDKIQTAANTVSAQLIIDSISHLFGAALVLTFMGIVVRMALRQYNTHSNCVLEAQERMTFTKTYLALMHDGKLTTDGDRKLVLESLFRPNAFSNTPEITFTTPIEMIYKVADKAKP
ncbi:DUF6161 domain-containing protein [Pseudomonas sp.]|uniref:DUF6161 domain-containing protein n=1 Tax=Pseudomonas sp. TaxID=306 RepID=UPI0031D2AD50